MLKWVLLMFIGLGSSSALAHAFLDHSLPAVGSILHESPHEIRLWFTERLEPAF